MEETLRSEKMRSTPVGKLLLTMSLPAMFSMLVQALYNVVDTIFVSMYGSEDGLTALSAAFPMQMIPFAFAIGIGVGTNVAVAKRLGEGKNDEAGQVAKTGLFLALVFSAVFAVLGLTIAKPFITAYTNNDVVKEWGTQYLTICMTFSLPVFVELVCSKVLQSTGNMKIPMISQLIGALTNIALDPIFIFVFKMGVRGAAIATVVGQAAAMFFVLAVFLFKKQDVSVFFKGLKLKMRNIADIFIVGIPTTFMNAVNSFVVIVLNIFLRAISDNGIAILGAYFKLQSFIFMPVFGLTQGLLPILSYNYGAQNKERFQRAYKLAVMAAAVIMAIGVLLFQAIPKQLMSMFVSSDAFLKDGSYAMRVISISFLFAAFNIVSTTLMQSLGKGLTSLLVSLLRQIALIIPIAALLAYTTGLTGFWFCYPIAEAAVFCLFIPLVINALRKVFKENTQIKQG